MRKIPFFVLLRFCQLTNAAENDPSVQDSDLQEAAQVETGSSQEIEEDGSDLAAVKILNTNEDEEESSHQEINAVMDVENLLDKNLPRFHVVGQGETSGAKKFKMASREIRFL